MFWGGGDFGTVGE